MNDNGTSLGQLKDLVERFVRQRDWQQFHDPKNLSMSIAIEAAELMEHFQWVRTDQLQEHLSDEKLRAAVREELADVLAFCLAMANVLQIDLAAALEEKMQRNAAKYPADRYRGRYKL